MKRITSLLMLLVVACASPSYPGIDNPSMGGNNSQKDKDIIA